jgi:hypothetical protein
MNSESTRNLLSLYRVDRPVDSKVRKAIEVAEGDETLRKEMDEQLKFDQRVVEVIRCLKPEPSLREKLGAPCGEPKSRARHALNPAILCAIFGVLLTVGVVIAFKLEADKDFPGRDGLDKFIEINNRMTGAELDRTNTKAGDLGDNLMLRGFDGYSLPSEVASLPAVGWRVLRHGPNGHRVVQVAIDKHNSLMFVFRSSDFGVEPGKSGEWRTFEHEGWAGAVRQHNDLCVLITFRGKEREMQKFIHSLDKP